MTSMTQMLIVGSAGFAGAVARWGMGIAVDRWVRTSIPLATFAVNIVGCFAVGVLVGWTSGRSGSATQIIRLAVGVGFLGAFTTFSAFTNETNTMLVHGQIMRASLYIALSLGVGLAALRFGIALAR